MECFDDKQPMSINNFPRLNTLKEVYETMKDLGSSLHEHMPEIHELASKSTRVLELGLNQGTSCVALLAGLNPGGMMVSVDLQGPLTPIRYILEWCAGDVRERSWVFMASDTLVAMRKMLAWGWTFDLVFIDSSHQYQPTKDELALAVSMMPAGGTILLHDTVSFKAEVYRAMMEFCHERGLEFTNRENCHGLGTVTVPGA